MSKLSERIDFKSIFAEVKSIFKMTFEEYNNYLNSLIEKIRFYKTELSVYKDPNKFRTLADEDIDKIYKELKKVFKGY